MNVLELIRDKKLREQKLVKAQMNMTKQHTCYIVRK